MPEGALGHAQPSERDRADIALGLDYLRATGPFDVGQAVVVAGQHVLAVEAAEGTDQMLARVAEMRANGRVRARRRQRRSGEGAQAGQDLRYDMPSIGPLTIEGVTRAGLAGIAVVGGFDDYRRAGPAGAAADRANIFVVGTPAGTGQ